MTCIIFLQLEVELSRVRHDGDVREKYRLARVIQHKVCFDFYHYGLVYYFCYFPIFFPSFLCQSVASDTFHSSREGNKSFII